MNKWLRICLLASLCVCVSGCGKESNSISENLINENPTQLTGDIVDRYVSENNTENIFGSVTNEVSSDNLSDNTISDNLVSGNEVSANEGIMISGNQAETNPFSGAGVSMNYVFTDEISNCLNIVNFIFAFSRNQLARLMISPLRKWVSPASRIFTFPNI